MPPQADLCKSWPVKVRSEETPLLARNGDVEFIWGLDAGLSAAMEISTEASGAQIRINLAEQGQVDSGRFHGPSIANRILISSKFSLFFETLV